jgi:hypothetical protein
MNTLVLFAVFFLSATADWVHIIDTGANTGGAYGRDGHAAGRLGDIYVVAGGYDDSITLDTVFTFDLVAMAQTANLAPLSVARYDSGFASTPEDTASGRPGYFFVAGGYNDSGIAVADIDIYATNGSHFTATLPSGPKAEGAAVFDGIDLVYFAGGRDETDSDTNTVDVLNITDWTWTNTTLNASWSEIDGSGANGVVLLTGGSAGGIQACNDPATGFFNVDVGSISIEKTVVVTVGDNIFIVSGFDDIAKYNFNKTWIFDTTTLTVSEGGQLPAGPGVIEWGLYGHYGAAVGPQIVITAGYYGDDNDDGADTYFNWYYDIAAQTWSSDPNNFMRYTDEYDQQQMVGFPNLNKAAIYGGSSNDNAYNYIYAEATNYNRHWSIYETECPAGTWGELCLQTCSCSGEPCDFTTGVCECSAGLYGPDCSSTCTCGTHGQCNDGSSGDGACTCDAHWYDANCTTQCDCNDGNCADGAMGDGSCLCPVDKWGTDCAANCTCDVAHGSCDVVTGECSRCDRDYYGANCDTACPCMNGGQCDDNGACTCANGFFGTTCDGVCDCNTGECNDGVDGDGSCTCAPGTFGADCAGTCPTCSGNGVCDEGSAGDGSCACNEGYYGTNCAGVCDCQNGATCVPAASGLSHTCTCLSGYFGPACGGKCNCNGTCVDGNTGDGACENCPKDFWGLDCQNLCDCQWFEHCNDDIEGDGFCDSGVALLPSFVVFVALLVGLFSS